VTQTEPQDKELKRVWDQKNVPVILRRDGERERLRLRLPCADEDERWLERGQKGVVTLSNSSRTNLVCMF